MCCKQNALKAEENYAATQKKHKDTSRSEHTDTNIYLDLKTKATQTAVEASQRVNVELTRRSKNQARQAAINANAAAFAAKVAAQKKGLTKLVVIQKIVNLSIAQSKVFCVAPKKNYKVHRYMALVLCPKKVYRPPIEKLISFFFRTRS